MKASYLMLQMLCSREYSSHEILFFLTSCLPTVNSDITYNRLQSISSREKEKAGEFLSPNIQFSSTSQRKGEIRNKKKKKTGKTVFQRLTMLCQ